MTKVDGPGPPAAFREQLLVEVAPMRAFAVSLCGNFSTADDLVQDALLKAWGNSDSFQPGTNMRAWLFTILRNTYYSLYRKRVREVQDSDGTYADRLSVAPTQESGLEFAEFRKAFAKLSDEYREALVLVGASGMSYDEAAEACGVPVGTIKSRVNRGRTRLGELLGIGSTGDKQSDSKLLAVRTGE